MFIFSSPLNHGPSRRTNILETPKKSLELYISLQPLNSIANTQKPYITHHCHPLQPSFFCLCDPGSTLHVPRPNPLFELEIYDFSSY